MKRKLKKLLKKFRDLSRRAIAICMALIMLFPYGLPTPAFALTGGPSQPEVQSFSPIGTSDMVDIFSGDFKYNIPLIDMDGYPINLAYNSGITMDQEASWVGLGWNINPGVINRSMRGVPDDFRGDKITKHFNMKPNETFGLKVGVGLESLGAETGPSASISYGIGVNYNNYNGVGVEQSLNLGISAGVGSYGKLNGGLGITSSSDNGLSVQPSVGLSFQTYKNDARNTAGVGLGLKVGTAFNSRSGLQQLTISAQASIEYAGASNNNQGSLGLAQASSSFDFGTPTYVPSVNLPMHNFSLTGNFKVGGELWGLHPNATLGGHYSTQRLITNTQVNPAYGYMNLDEGAKYGDAVLDFNREKDGSFTPNTPALPITSLTYDLYSVSGQGIGGSYRPFRSEIGHVYDPYNYTTSDGFDIGIEVGLGNLLHIGTDLTSTSVNTTSGKWTNNNSVNPKLNYRASVFSIPTYENVYFKEANEKSVDSDPNYFASMGGFDPERFELQQLSKFNTRVKDEFRNHNGSSSSVPSNNFRSQRDKRNQVIHPLTYGEVTTSPNGFGLNDRLFYDGLHAPSIAENHHIAEITTYGTDGMRYVYGISAYNKVQKEVTFSVGEKINAPGSGIGCVGNCPSTGLITYTSGANTANNTYGIDNYFSSTETPPYAHSYLLTAVLSPDYIDADNIQGPSDGDLGYYTRFYYSPLNTSSNTYKWRVPVEANSATYNEGLKSDPTDDKANYIYGEKELWYVDSIVSKNYIAVFYKEPRADARGVVNENGGMDNSSGNAMKLLRKISLFTLREFRSNPSPVPIKEVHFQYDYSLCQDASNKLPNNNTNAPLFTDVELSNQGGKLTLKKVFFTYQNSKKAQLSPYEFDYDAGNTLHNPSYNIKAYDRWGYFKPNNGQINPSQPFSPAEFPYVDQMQTPTQANANLSAWNLREILLPSGGKIKVNYEADDYAFVQNKPAMQMFKIIGVGNNPSHFLGKTDQTTAVHPLDNEIPSPNTVPATNRILYFELQPGFTSAADIGKYFAGIDKLYFRSLMKFDPIVPLFDYVSGYAEIQNYGVTTANGVDVGWVKLKDAYTKDNNQGDVLNPIAKAAIQFGRLNLSRFIWSQPGVGTNPTLGTAFLNALANSSFVQNIGDAVDGPNLAIWKDGKGREIVINKSFIRLNSVAKKKFGGGCRVKKIEMSDEWNKMTNLQMNTFQYGQEYQYTLVDGKTSSGVASYEPQLGGDENPWRKPVAFSTEKLLAPDDEHYMEEPFGESFFPSASVGYSRVVVQNLQYAKVNRHATGKVVHEFYTSKDFPTITNQTDLVHKQEKTDKFSISSLFNVKAKDYMTATQGFVVELNDMHGKPKTQSVYQEDNTTPISSVEYRYKTTPYGVGSFRLDNSATVIDPLGNVKPATIGVFFDMAADMRQQRTELNTSATMINLDMFMIPPIPAPIPIPMFWPSNTEQITQFRSATTTKIIQRFGLLEETIATDLGSKVSTNNLAYDSETGEILLTQTTTNFNDKVYTLNYPAHWYYDGMGQAYRNLNIQFNIPYAGSPQNAHIFNNASKYFVPGDELKLSTGQRGWVLSVSGNKMEIILKDGSQVTSTVTAKVIRSGRKNMAGTTMESATLLSNPLANFKNNLFDNVLQASAIEFTDKWRTFCDCFPASTLISASTNPYILGTRGNWRKKKSLLHLAGRSQSNYDNNTNIRIDGVFTSFRPYYRLNSNQWQIDEKDWTFTSEVTEFSPFGQELENMDALGRFSAATFGYRQTLPTSVAANTKYRDLGFDHFEDYGFSPCADNHFKFPGSSNINTSQSHTGRHSIQVNNGNSVTMIKPLEACDIHLCSLDISISQLAGTTILTYLVQINSGIAPFQIDYNVIQGNPVVNYNGTGLTIAGSGWTIEVIVIDATGCKTTKIFSH